MKNVEAVLPWLGVTINTGSRNTSGRYIPVNCPFCGDGGGHGGFSKTTGHYNCFRCHETGSLWQIGLALINKDRLIQAFIHAGIFTRVTWNPLQDRDMEKLVQEALSAPTIAPPEQVTVTLEAPPSTYWNESLMIPFHRSGPLLQYLTKRGIMAKYYGALAAHFPFFELKEKDPNEEWSFRMLNRLLVPVRIDGELVSWTGRSLLETQKVRYLTPPKDLAKYACQLTVYPFDFLSQQQGELLLIQEGVFDGLLFNLTFGKTGVGSVTVFTNNMVPQQVTWLERIASNFKHVLIVLDRREYTQAVKVVRVLRPVIPNLVGFWSPTQFKDTGDLSEDRILELAEYLLNYVRS